MRRNILHAIESRDATAFLKILDDGFKQAAKAASADSHALGLRVADARRSHQQAQRGDNGSLSATGDFEPSDS